MRWFFFFLFLLSIVGSLLYISGQLNFKNTHWLQDYPKIINTSATNTQVVFAVSEPAAIYWRIYKTPITKISPHDFTNTNDIDKLLAYGGNISRGTSQYYTNTITNLLAQHQYTLYATAVSYIGEFPKSVYSNTFTTSP